jgi:hypothetical protein
MSDDFRPLMSPGAFSNDDDDDFDPIEAYCMSCRDTVEIEGPEPVWTSQGRPGTRGTCPICGGMVYRMGHTAAHDRLKRPEAVQVVDNTGIRNTKAAKIKIEAATYVVGVASDQTLIEQLAEDLDKIGISTWTDNAVNTEEVNWAGGVHPAFDQCKRMVVVLSAEALISETVTEAWRYFRDQRKPVIVVLAEAVEPPDDLRSRPRFDLFSDYKRGFRQLMQELSR